MPSAVPIWAQMLIPTFLWLATQAFRKCVRPPSPRPIDVPKFTKASLIFVIAVHVGLFVATPIGFGYFNAIVIVLEKVWTFFSCVSGVGCIALITIYATNEKIEMPDQIPSRAAKLIEKLISVFMLTGYIKISEVMWVNSKNDVAGQLQSQMFSESYSMFFTLYLWGVVGTILLARTILPSYKANWAK